MIVPWLMYADAGGAIAFLCRAFGFEERARYAGPDGKVLHAELAYREASVWLASPTPGSGFGDSPLNLPTVHGQTVCFVVDVDAHAAHARAKGATIVAEPLDEHGMRFYRALDTEGHRWIFARMLGGDGPR
jgi:uncharacterized glyoxalase superfamily protein PhnB